MKVQPKLTNEDQDQIGFAFTRLETTIDELRSRSKGAVTVSAQHSKEHLLDELIEQIIKEKLRLNGVMITYAKNEKIKVKCDSIQFQTVLSNLINNSIEAMNHSNSGHITISSTKNGNMALIEISDNGPGIPPVVIESFGVFGSTYNKANGSGIGLYHAKKTIQEMGGSLTLSNNKRGAVVSIVVPCQNEITLSRILIEDDILIRAYWESEAKKSGHQLKTFRHWDDFKSVADQFDRSSHVYYDSYFGSEDLSNTIQEGLETFGFKNHSGISMTNGIDSKDYPG